MAIYIQTPNGLYPVGGQVTKSKIIEALGYTPSAFDGDYNSLTNRPEIIEDGSDSFYIADTQGNIIFKVDSNGIHSVNLTLNGKTINQIIQENSPSGDYSGDYNDLKNKPEILEDGSDELSIVDSQGNIVAKITSEGIHAVNFLVGENKDEVALAKDIPTDGTSGEDGREVELQTSPTHIQWRYVGDSTWTDLISLADLKGADGSDGSPGADGIDGKSVELQVNAGYIKWRKEGDSNWTNLVSLEDLANEVPPGNYYDLENRPEILEDESAELSVVDSQGNIIFKVDSNGIHSVNLTLDGKTINEVIQESTPNAGDGTNGEDGREIELQKNTTHIQWRYVGDTVWNNLVALTDLKGADGADGKSIELQKTSTHIQWRQTGGSWTNLIALSELKGADGTNGVDGKSVELRVNAGNIEWRQEGGSWTVLMSLEDLANEAHKKHITLYINDLSNVTEQEKIDIINTLTPLMNAGDYEENINPELFSNIMLVVGNEQREVYMLKRIDDMGQLTCYLYFETTISGIKKSIELYVNLYEGYQDVTLNILDDEPVSKMLTVTNTTFTINSSNVYNNTTIIANSSSNMTITIPLDYSLRVGTMLNIIKANLTSVDVNITGGSGVTLYHNGATGTYKIPKQYQGCTLVKQSNSAWYIIGPEA